jgi:hypothetical protein
MGDEAMDDILASSDLGDGRSMHVASLARETILESQAEHLGFHGYFLFETSDTPGVAGVNILGKVASFDAAMRLIELLNLANEVSRFHSDHTTVVGSPCASISATTALMP